MADERAPYRHRVVDSELTELLDSAGGVVIEGPKFCGKTRTAERQAASTVNLDDPNARRALDVDPTLVLEGDRPRLIDEWQVEPSIWNRVRRAIDEAARPGQFILAGCAVPTDDATRHTGAGRFARLRMRPMSLFESGDSSGEVSLAALLDRDAPRAGAPDLTVRALAEKACRGGWPGYLSLESTAAVRAVRSYLDEIRRTDVSRVDGARRDPERVGRLLASLGRNVGTYATARTLTADTGGREGQLAESTVSEYLDALERLMIVEDQPAWSPHLRSKSRLRSSPKRHFVDPSLAVAAVGGTPNALLDDLEYFGFVFEGLVVRDLRVYAQASDAEVLQYRDNTGLEVDAIVRARDGRWLAVEVKLGEGQVDEAARNLLRFRDERVDLERVGEPGALVVVVSTGFSYVRSDGVGVVSIGALGP